MGRVVRCFGPLLVALLLLTTGPAQAAPLPAKAPPSSMPAQRGELAEAERLAKEAERLGEEGKYAEALPLAERALAMRERVLGGEHVEVAASLRQVGELCHVAARLPCAESFYQRALAIREKALGPDHLDVAMSLHNLGTLYSEQGALARAESFYLRSLAIREKALGQEHPDVAESLNNLAALYYSQGTFAHAESLYKRSLAIREKALGSDHLDVSESLYNLALVYKNKGAFSLAEPLYRRALTIQEKSLGHGHPQTAYTIHGLASLYREQDMFARAEPLYQRAIAIQERALGHDHPAVADSLNGLAVLYREQGALDRAESLYRRSLDIREKVYGREYPLVATSLINLASIYIDKGAFEQAESLSSRALVIMEKTLGPNHPSVARALSNLLLLYCKQGAFARAETVTLRALAIREKALGPDHLDFGKTLHYAALLAFYQGDFLRAESSFSRTLTLRQRALGPDHHDTADTLHQQALLAATRGDLDRALQDFAHAALGREHSLRLELGSMSEARKLSRLGLLRDETHALLSFQTQFAPQSEPALHLALSLVLERKGRVLDELADNTASLRQGLTPELQAKLDELTDKRTQLSVRSNASYDAKRAKATAEELASLRKDIDRLEGELSAQSAAFRTQNEPVKLEAVQAVLPEGATLVEFVRYRRYDFQSPFRPWREERYAAYLLRRQGPPRFVDLGEATGIDARVRAARVALAHPASDAQPALRALDALVLAPLRRALGPTPHLLLSPDSELNLVPFEALVDEQGHYLLETTLVTYLSSGRDLSRLRERPPPRSGPLVLAGPDYGPGEPFGPLPGAAAEATEVRRRFPRTAVLQGATATKQALAQTHGPLFLHVATHGFFRGPTARPTTSVAHLRGTTIESGPPAPEPSDDPAEALDAAGLAFAGANQNPEALLSARELASLDLQGTALAVLSACESGVGQVASGEGVYGLRRALVVAGAASQVVSLWSVNDVATSRLMGAYYGELAAGRGRSEALRRARLAMLEQPATAHPYYWAAFVPAGDWRPLEGEGAVARVRPGGACGCHTAGGGSTGTEPALALAALAAVATYARRKRPCAPPPPPAPGRSSSGTPRADEPPSRAPRPWRASLAHRDAP